MATGRVEYTASGQARYFIDGKRVSKKQYDRRFPSKLDLSAPPPFVSNAAWPLESLALSVDASQVAEARQLVKEHGIAADYRDDGTCVLRSRGARKELMKARGFHDLDGGYGD